MAVPLVIFERSAGSDQWYQVDLSNQDFLAAQDLASVSFSVVSGTITVSATSVSGKKVFLRVSGTTAGRAKLEVKATAEDGQVFDQPVDFVTTNRAA
jgi:hypothetical protein